MSRAEEPALGVQRSAAAAPPQAPGKGKAMSQDDIAAMINSKILGEAKERQITAAAEDIKIAETDKLHNTTFVSEGGQKIMLNYAVNNVSWGKFKKEDE